MKFSLTPQAYDLLPHEAPNAYRYRKPNGSTISELEESYIYFSSRKKFDDPFDSTSNLFSITKNKKSLRSFLNKIGQSLPGSILDKIEREIKGKDFTFIHSYIKDGLNQYIDKFGIACFTRAKAFKKQLYSLINFYSLCQKPLSFSCFSS